MAVTKTGNSFPYGSKKDFNLAKLRCRFTLAAHFLFQPLNWIAVALGVIAAIKTMTQGYDISRYRARIIGTWIGHWYPVISRQYAPQSTRATTDSAAILPVFQSEKPIGGSEVFRQAMSPCAIAVLVHPCLFGIFLLPFLDIGNALISGFEIRPVLPLTNNQSVSGVSDLVLLEHVLSVAVIPGLRLVNDPFSVVQIPTAAIFAPLLSVRFVVGVRSRGKPLLIFGAMPLAVFRELLPVGSVILAVFLSFVLKMFLTVLAVFDSLAIQALSVYAVLHVFVLDQIEIKEPLVTESADATDGYRIVDHLKFFLADLAIEDVDGAAKQAVRAGYKATLVHNNDYSVNKGELLYA